MVEFKAILNKRWCNDLTPKWYAIPTPQTRNIDTQQKQKCLEDKITTRNRSLKNKWWFKKYHHQITCSRNSAKTRFV